MMNFRVRCQTCQRRLGAGEDWHPIGDKKFVGNCCKEKQDADVSLVQVPPAATER